MPSTDVQMSFDEPNLVANAGLLLVGTLVVRLQLARLVNATVFHRRARGNGVVRSVRLVDDP